MALKREQWAKCAQWQDPVFSHAGTASYPWYQMVWQGIQRSSQRENETTRRHSLFGHICRLPENTPASQALQLSIEAHTGTPPPADWKRPPGRPRRNWLQQVEEDIDLSVGAAWIAAQDRSMWRTLRPSAGQTQQWVSEWLIALCQLVFPKKQQHSLMTWWHSSKKFSSVEFVVNSNDFSWILFTVIFTSQ